MPFRVTGMTKRIQKYAVRTFSHTALFVLVALIPMYSRAAEGIVGSPLNSAFSTVPGFIEGALKALVMIALPILTLFIVYAGFRFISSQGNDTKLSEAKKNFMYVIIGALLILGAWVIATLIGGTVSQLTTG